MIRTKFLTAGQAISILALFTIGSSLNIGLNAASKQDAWFVILLGLLLATPMICGFARLLSLYPGQGLYDIVFEVFGRVFGRIFILLFLLHLIMVGALILRNFAEFLQVVSMPETPEIIFLILMSALCVWMVRRGMNVFGRWAKIVLALVFFVEVPMFILSIENMDLNNLKPVMGTNFNTLMSSSMLLFSLPFTETVIFATLFGHIKPIKNPYKIYWIGISIGAVLLSTATLRNILVLGVSVVGDFYFPSYSAAGIISVGDFLSRIEVLIGMLYVLTGFSKITVCLFAASEGLSKVLNKRKCTDLAVPVVLLMLTLAQILFTNTLEMYNWLQKVFQYYALPFQVVLPLILLAGAEIKTRLGKLGNP
ncbi:GerAB/ArcD/ProY family transporter [Ethanoligenens sp.]|uniref:GerAB/ArcD/ProY family transporter n=1 Tax=Ethanoligenens sp. TaxID=2099655 RepID=UPI0039EA1F8A